MLSFNISQHDFTEYCIKLQFCFAILGIIVNIFHLTVLTRKAMRANFVNVIMIGIGLTDFCNMIGMVYYDVIFVNNFYDECHPPMTYLHQTLHRISITAEDISRRLTTWFGFFLVFLRYLIIKNALNPKYSLFSKPMFSLKIMAFSFLLSAFLSISYFYRRQIVEADYPWTPPENCSNTLITFISPYFIQVPVIELVSDESLAVQIFNIVDALLKLIPASMFPVLTYFLMRERSKAKKKVVVREGAKPDHTTELIILMTITFMISECPFGVFYIIRGLFPDSHEIRQLTSDLIDINGVPLSINASTSCLINIVISSQYRKTAQGLFWTKKTSQVNSSVITVQHIQRSH